MCQIHEQDKLLVLKRVLCNWMSVSEFYYLRIFNNVIILKNRILLTLDGKCTTVGTIPITYWYNSDQWHLPQIKCLLPFAPTHISWYQALYFWKLPSHLFSYIWYCDCLNRKITIVLFADDFFVTMNLSSALVPINYSDH
jgi:hypothetical protein